MPAMKDVQINLTITDHQGHESLKASISIRDECFTRQQAVSKLRRIIEILQTNDPNLSKEFGG